MNHIKWIWDLWKKHKLHLLLLLFLTVISVSVAVAYPYVFKKLLDTLHDILLNPSKYPSPYNEVVKIVWILVAVGVAKLISSFYPSFRAYMNLLFEYVLRKKYFSHLLKKDYNFYLKFRTGDLVTRLTDDLADYPKISWFLCSGIFRAFNSFMKIIFFLVVMFLLNWKLTLLSISPLPVMVLIFYITSEKLYKRFRKNQEAISEINNQLEMSFSGARIIKAFVCEDKYRRFFDEALMQRFKAEMKVVKLNTILNMIYRYVDLFAQIGVVAFGGYMVVKGEITIGTFYAFYSYLSMMIYPILDIPQLFVSGKQAFVNIDRLEEIKNYPEIAQSRKDKIKIDTINEIQFKDIDFSYEGRKVQVLKGLNFKVKKGEKVVIIGPVGSGKSTILGLLTGILKPQKGKILVNNIPLDDIDLLNFREKIGFVPQDPFLFSGSIKDNIFFGRDDVDEKFYRKIIEIVQMKEEIERFKQQDSTKVGERGLSLSGGQKQRLAIARALIRSPEILILDDITANLDAENEHKLWQEIKTLFNNITCFVVSHRLSTIQYADKVIFINSGMVVGFGKHKELISRYPQYKSFIEKHYMEPM